MKGDLSLFKLFKSRSSKNLMKKVVITSSIAVVLTASVAFLVYRLENSKLIRERAKYERILAQEQAKLYKYEQQSKSGWILTRNVEAGETIEVNDIKQSMLPDYFTPSNVITDPEEIVGKVIKIKALANTAVTGEMVYAEGPLDRSTRNEETEYVRLPVKLAPKDTVDIRIVYPNGEDYIVVAKKKLSDFNQERQQAFFQDTESEALLLQAALVDAYINNAELYMKTYVEPEMQEAPPVTYVPNLDVLKEIQNNPLIVKSAKWKLQEDLRKSLEKRLSNLDPMNIYRVGASAPVGSAVSRLKVAEGATPTQTTTQNNGDAVQQNGGVGSAEQGSTNSNNPSLLQPNTNRSKDTKKDSTNNEVYQAPTTTQPSLDSGQETESTTTSEADKTTVYPTPKPDIPNVTEGNAGTTGGK